MLSFSRFQRLHSCLQKSTIKSVIVYSKSLCSFHRKCVLFRAQCRYMSIDSDSDVKNQHDVKKLLEDATVPEESTVAGDTENWTTTPYPKGLNLHLNSYFVFVLNITYA